MVAVRYLLILVFCFALAGCASTENYEKILESWVGADADSLIRKWGPPDSSFELSDGSKVLQWSSRRTIKTGGYRTYQPVTTHTSGTLSTSTYGSYGGSYSGSGLYSGTSTTYVPTTTPTRTYDMRCITRFTVSTSNVIQSWTWQGNDCRA